MQIALRFLFSFLVITFVLCGHAKTIYDSPEENIQELFIEARARYILRYNHTFIDTLKVPEGCELVFDGGSLAGPIVFMGTKLSGKVNLRGASVSGRISNKEFEANWLCYMDGVSDDARCINDMICVCDRIHFPKGQYRLRSMFYPSGVVDKALHSQLQTHIGINKSNVKLIGDEGAEFVTDVPLGTIFVFSLPNQIENSIRNIEISGLTFTVHNDGKEFHEFMHTIKMMGVNGMTIKNCKFNDFFGDAICLSHYGDNPQTGERTRNQNVRIHNNSIIGGSHHNNRNGVSIINGKDVIVKNNVIMNTSRKDMPGGVDIEPNNSAYTIENIVIEKNLFDGIKGDGGAIQAVFLRDEAPGHHIIIRNNRIYNSTFGITIAIRTTSSTSNFVIEDNYVDSETKPYVFIGNGSSENWKIMGNVFERPCKQNIPGQLKVKKLVMKKNKKKRVLSWVVEEYPVTSTILTVGLLALGIATFIQWKKRNMRKHS